MTAINNAQQAWRHAWRDRRTAGHFSPERSFCVQHGCGPRLKTTSWQKRLVVKLRYGARIMPESPAMRSFRACYFKNE
ncbi:hypothetical protein [Janthinobacterium sp.]|uniref:hypothetical protein n=1 Tax=Janthinobacterium sp. TaxID=1871054 RepID=UPI0025BFF9A5|nr:hypothetical protein [Janthinobacterium sp.]